MVLDTSLHKSFVTEALAILLIVGVSLASLPAHAAPLPAAQEKSAQHGLLRDFTLDVSPTYFDVANGSVAQATVHVNRTRGFSAPIGLSYNVSTPDFPCSSILKSACATPPVGDPKSLKCSFTPSLLAPRRVDNSTLSCTGPTGTYRVTVNATGGQISHAASLLILVCCAITITTLSSTVTVSFLPFFSIDAPTAFTINAGDVVVVPITVVDYNANVILSVDAPPSLSCTLDHTTVPFSGPATGQTMFRGDVNLSCLGNMIGDFIVTVRSSDGIEIVPRETPIAVHVVSTLPAPTPNGRSPATIFGLGPLFYSTIAGIVVLVGIAIAILLFRRKNEGTIPSAAQNNLAILCPVYCGPICLN